MISQPNDSQIFGYFRMGLAIGIVERQAVIAWADRTLLEDPSPSNELIELSLSGHLPYSQLIRLLTSFVPLPDYDLPIKLLLAHAGLSLEREPDRTVDLVISLRLLDAEEYLPGHIRASLADLSLANDQYCQGFLAFPAFFDQVFGFLRPYQSWRPIVFDLCSYRP
jgi:hypothetical protein